MKKNKFNPEKKVPVWQKVVGYLNILMLVGQLSLPSLAHAFVLFDEAQATQELNNSSSFQKVNNFDTQFVKSEYIVETQQNTQVQTIESFHKKLVDHKKHGLQAPQYIPILNNGITIIFPHYELKKRVGDRFVQSRMIRSQIYASLNRTLISDSYTSEAQQINALYNNAYDFAGSTNAKFGDKVTASQVTAFNKNFIWPELRTINGEPVLVPVVQLTQATIDKLSVDGHVAEFGGSVAEFNNITINSGTLKTQRDTFIKTAENLTVNPGAEIRADGDLNLFVGGTLQNLSGRLSANQNVDIIAGQYQQKTMVHRYATRYEQGTRLGEIASVDANGNIRIRSYGDIVVEGGTISGNTIGLKADGNIILKSQQTSYVNNQPVGGYDSEISEVKHLTTKLNAQDSIFLMASGAIELNAAELYADQGVIEILAANGVYIANAFDQFQSQRYKKWGRTTEQEQEFETIAIRSALEAGRGVMIASEFGDITLQAADIKSGSGTDINARNGRVNLLLAKEQDHYFYNKVKKGFWKIKTETIQNTTDTAVYNEIIGGVKVQATQGITLELGQYDGESTADVMAKFSATEDLAWMSDLYNDPEYSENIELVYQKLEELHIHDKTSSLSPAAMAIIAIAVAVAMGPAGAGWIAGGANPIAGYGFISASAMQAGAVTLATSAATSLANGDGIDGAVKKITSSDGLRSLAISMATAGVLNSEAMESFNFFNNAEVGSSLYNSKQAIDIANQATTALVRSTVSASISTLINGGDLSDFNDSLKSTLLTAAAHELGKSMANKIKLHAADNNWNDAVRYIAHAGAGCIYGAALAEAANTSANGKTCASGAGGAAIGEIIGDIHTKEKVDALQDEAESTLTKLKDKIVNDPSLSDMEVAEQLKALRDNEGAYFQGEFERLRAAGVDLAKLGAGLSAFAAGGDVDIAASAGQNAAENNAIWFLAIPFLLKALDVALTLYELNEIAKIYDTQGRDEGDRAMQNYLTEIGIELAVSQLIPGSRTLKALGEKLDELGLGEVFEKIEAFAIRRAEPATANQMSMSDSMLDSSTTVNKYACGKGGVINCSDYEANVGELITEFKKHVKNTKYTDDDFEFFARNGYTFDPNTKRFSSPKGKQSIDEPAVKGQSEPQNLTDFPELQNSKVDITLGGVEHKGMTLEKLVKLRDEISNNPQRSTDIDVDNLAKARKGQVSEAIAELVTSAYGNKLPGAKPLQAALPGKGKQGQFDKIYTYTNSSGETRLLILEAKGGNSQLGSRMYDGKRVEQGSTSYVQSVVENMQREYNKAIGAGNNSAEIKALGNTLEAFKNYSGKIEFRKVQQGFQTGSSLKPTFDVTNYTIGNIRL